MMKCFVDVNIELVHEKPVRCLNKKIDQTFLLELKNIKIFLLAPLHSDLILGTAFILKFPTVFLCLAQ